MHLILWSALAREDSSWGCRPPDKGIALWREPALPGCRSRGTGTRQGAQPKDWNPSDSSRLYLC
ncbi:hypothetical protein [Pontibacter chitinilyticus]|uniref:hypothetical protein n=1 Tax=Pontibacter chitinilyticus TaxID=2674989 RepID=UPI00321AFC52